MFSFIRPEFFDIFGLAVFGYLVFLSLLGLRNNLALTRIHFIILLIIGILGLAVDGSIVYLTYIK